MRISLIALRSKDFSEEGLMSLHFRRGSLGSSSEHSSMPSLYWARILCNGKPCMASLHLWSYQRLKPVMTLTSDMANPVLPSERNLTRHLSHGFMATCCASGAKNWTWRRNRLPSSFDANRVILPRRKRQGWYSALQFLPHCRNSRHPVRADFQASRGAIAFQLLKS